MDKKQERFHVLIHSSVLSSYLNWICTKTLAGVVAMMQAQGSEFYSSARSPYVYA